LFDSREDSFFAGELGVGGEVMPVEEPAHEGRGGDGLDLLAERAEGEAVDALENAALAPLFGVRVGRGSVLEDAAHGEALQFHGEEGLVDVARV
jgi:hypothetical protein